MPSLKPDNDVMPRELYADTALRQYRTCSEEERSDRWKAYQRALRKYGYREKNAPDDPEETNPTRWRGPDCQGRPEDLSEVPLSQLVDGDLNSPAAAAAIAVMQATLGKLLKPTWRVSLTGRGIEHDVTLVWTLYGNGEGKGLKDHATWLEVDIDDPLEFIRAVHGEFLVHV